MTCYYSIHISDYRPSNRFFFVDNVAEKYELYSQCLNITESLWKRATIKDMLHSSEGVLKNKCQNRRFYANTNLL